MKRFFAGLGVTLCVSSCSAPDAHELGVDSGVAKDASVDATVAYTCTLPTDAGIASTKAVRFSELLSSNQGVNVDERGQTDDWLELVNQGPTPVSLAGWSIRDVNGKRHPLPNLAIGAGETVLLWADDDEDQGDHHLGFKLSSHGESLTLWSNDCEESDRVELPALEDNESYARVGEGFARCRYATPGRANGARCNPPAPPALPVERTYPAFTWPDGWPTASTPLSLSELGLRPASFIEVLNTSQSTVTLADYALVLLPTQPDSPLPDVSTGRSIAWPVATLAAGARVAVPLSAVDTAALEAHADFEGAAVLFANGKLVDRVEFSAWPSGATLARIPDGNGAPTFCSNATAGTANQCNAIASRTIGDRVHALQTPGDFAALAVGSTESGQQGVKFIVDISGQDTVHLLGNARWALHYTFIREYIEHAAPLDRCDRLQARAFNQGWYDFSVQQYGSDTDDADGRRYLLGTLIKYSNGLKTVEFAAGDHINTELMRRAFLAVVARTPNPREWSLRAGDALQPARMEPLVGTLPIVDRNAPFRGLTYQPLTLAEGFGTLRFVASSELANTPLGPDTIVVTDDVPNDVPFVGGLITEAFQAPLAHVNVLSEARGTPNMALRDARTDARLAPLFGKLVRLVTKGDDFELREATPTEADAYWQARKPSGPRTVPPTNFELQSLVPLPQAHLAALPAVGAKAAQFSELYHVTSGSLRDGECVGKPFPFSVPPSAFAVPIAHYRAHFEASGARDKLTALMADATFRADSAARAAGLADVRNLMLTHPVEPTILAMVSDAISQRFGTRRVRLRSSSNTEDLPTFNGAGLHTSTSAAVGDSERTIEDGLRTVWSSLWNMRAYDERENANIDQTAAAMGVLVHEQFADEAAQGVAISRNLLDPSRDDSYYINAQFGEASVTNPAPGVVTEQVLYSLPSMSYMDARFQTYSSLTNGRRILSDDDLLTLGCSLQAIHNFYHPLLDPSSANRLFAMQIEFKFDAQRKLVVKQARPQPFGHLSFPTDCR